MNNKIIIKNAQGKEQTYDILFSFESANTHKNYIVYTDFTKENNIIKCYASIYENGQVSPIDTEAENQIVITMLNTLTESTKIKYRLMNQ